MEKTWVKPQPLPQEEMTIQEHLEDRLKNTSKYTPSNEDSKIIKYEGIETFIYRKLTSTKFRKTSVDSDSEKRVKKAIHLNVSNNSPIKLTYPFGAYKIWRVPTYPKVDWAEFLTISYVCRYVAPILAAYKPGAEITFSSDDVVIELIDNYPRKDLDAYVSSFRELLAAFGNYFPENLKVELKQVVPDIYSLSDYNKELKELFSILKATGLSEERKVKLRKAFEFNFQRKGKDDLTSDLDYQKALDDLMIYSEVYLQLTKRRAFVRGEDKVVLFSQKIPNALDIGSTSVSKAKFWVGMGVLEQAEGKFYDRIMTPKQWEENKTKVKWVNTSLIALPNFEKIPVFNERFNFLKSE